MPVIMEGILRAVFVFIVLLVMTRLIGKHNNAHLTFFDYVTGVSVGAMGAIMAVNFDVNIWGAFAGLLTFIVLMILNGYLSLESRPLRKLLQGEAVVVVNNGKILEGNLALLRYSIDDITTLLREKGYFNISDVEYAIIETDGRLRVLPSDKEI